MYLIELPEKKVGTIALAPGFTIQDVAQGRRWLEIGAIPDAPIEALLVDWNLGTVAVDPDYVLPKPPNWEGLVAEVMSNAEFKAAWIAAAAIDPTIAWSLPTAFGMVGQGHFGNFINLFNAICALADVTLEQRGIWADIGAAFNAPPGFLDIVRGTNGE